MGLGGLHIWHLLILLVIIVLLFGTKKLKNIGSDLGAAIKGFKGAMAEGQREGEQNAAPIQQQPQQPPTGQTIEGQATREKEKS